MKPIRIHNGTEAIELLGQPRPARRKVMVQRREPTGPVETVQTGHGPQDAVQGIDWVAINPDGSEYPYKKRIFANNMEEAAEKPGYFRKKVPSQLLTLPEGMKVECITLEGGEAKPVLVEPPDFVAVGTANEVYPLPREQFDREFEWLLAN